MKVVVEKQFKNYIHHIYCNFIQLTSCVVMSFPDFSKRTLLSTARTDTREFRSAVNCRLTSSPGVALFLLNVKDT